MIVNTKAIVLNAVKYGDSDLITKCYTEFGIKSYLLKRILKSKKGKLKLAYFQPLTQLELVASHNNKGKLNYIKEVKISYPYFTIYSNIIKQTITIFLSEILSKTLKEEETNKELFEYLETSLIWLDTHDKVSNFHLLFLLNLTKYLGFYPDKENSNFNFFDLNEGRFLLEKPKMNYITEENLFFFKLLLGTNFDALNKLEFTAKQRHQLIDVLIQYFELHLSGFSKPKSLTILKTVFV